MRSLLLDAQDWDLCLDAYGNIAVAGEPYSLAQDAACAIRLFLGELWYDTTDGVPYFEAVLGKYPPISLLKSQLAAAALSVPGVVSAQVYISDITDRRVTGTAYITDKVGTVIPISFGGSSGQSVSATAPSSPLSGAFWNNAYWDSGVTWGAGDNVGSPVSPPVTPPVNPPTTGNIGIYDVSDWDSGVVYT